MDILGPQWEDDGDPGTSLDLTDPPPACVPYMPVFDSRTQTVLHEFSYLPTADGTYEQGHINIAGLRATSTTMVSNELAAVARPSFGACAEASAVRRFQEDEAGTIDGVTARIVALPVSGVVVWRAAVANHTSDGGSHTMYLDVAYLGSGNLLVKVRIMSCGCRPPVSTDAPLMTGEVGALQWISFALASSARSA